MLLWFDVWQRLLTCDRRSDGGHISNLGILPSGTENIIEKHCYMFNMPYTYCDIARDTDDWRGHPPPVSTRALPLAARHRRTPTAEEALADR